MAQRANNSLSTSHQDDSPLQLPLHLSDYFSSPSPTFDNKSPDMTGLPFSIDQELPEFQEPRRLSAVRKIKFPFCTSTPTRDATPSMGASSWGVGGAQALSPTPRTPSNTRLPDSNFTSSRRKIFSFNAQDSLPYDVTPMQPWSSPEDQQTTLPGPLHLHQDGPQESPARQLFGGPLQNTPQPLQGFLDSSLNLQKTPDSIYDKPPQLHVPWRVRCRRSSIYGQAPSRKFRL